MLSAEELQQISEILDKKLDPIKEDISEVKENIRELKEHTEVTRYAANLAVEWIDTYFRDEYPLKEIINKQQK